ncbi:MAG: GTP pyrophosphokinase [bacterium]
MSLINKYDFLKKYNIDENKYKKATISWDDLVNIFNNYEITKNDFDPIAQFIVSKLRKVEKVHFAQYRIKNSEHLIEKIIRKKIEKSCDIKVDNYKEKITDLIGVRILHLFKEDWNKIHKFIIDEFDLLGKPTAYVRKGDEEKYIEHFKQNNCDIEEHKLGYRSVHYLIKSALSKKQYITEIQVRTIFEEGWSEIDHKIRYPYNKNNIILEKFLTILNRFAGNADEMASFISFLQRDLDKNKAIIQKLKHEIDELKIDHEKKKEIKENIDNVSGLYASASILSKYSGLVVAVKEASNVISHSGLLEATKIAQQVVGNTEALTAAKNVQQVTKSLGAVRPVIDENN